MLDVVIRRLSVEQVDEVIQFFKMAISDTFAKEGLEELVDEINREVENKKVQISEYFESNGESRYFLVALLEGRIVGTIASGKAGSLINECTNNEIKNVLEIGSIYVHPNYQRQGIGTMLLKKMYQTLLEKNVEEFCLDSGYKRAQKIWKRKFGEPEYLMKDWWGEGADHMIWRVRFEHLLY